MSALAHYIEDEGLSTVVVALVREHIEQMKPPRAIWVPYELGRPFGEPDNPELQTRILNTALSLLDEDTVVPLLVDFEDPEYKPANDFEWSPPELLGQKDIVNEAKEIIKLWEQRRDSDNRSTFGVSDLLPLESVEYVLRYHSDNPFPNPKGMARISRARFAIDDIKTLYFEAALANSKQPSSLQLQDWFWQQTQAGEMILDFQQLAESSSDNNLNLIAGSLVPAERVRSFTG